MKVCPFCNAQYSDDVKFCQQCGHELQSANPEAANTQNSYETNPQNGYNANPQNGYNANPQNDYNTNPQNGYNANQQSGYNANQQYNYNANPQNGYNANPQYNMNNNYQQDYTQNNYSEPTASLGSMQLNTTKLTVWSIVNLICCCMPLGIAGLVFSLTAKNKPTPDAQNKALQNALTMNMIGTIGGAVVQILYVIMMVSSGLAAYQI